MSRGSASAAPGGGYLGRHGRVCAGVIGGVAGVLHEDELTIGLSTVRALVDRALPGCRALPLRRLAAPGSTNALFRLGEDLLVRLPRRPGGSATILKEARWLPRVGACLPVPVPAVIAVGEPGFGYPEHWSIMRWIDGVTATVADSSTELAGDLAAVVTALRAVAVPPEALEDPALRWYRGTPLVTQDRDTRLALVRCQAIAGLDLDLTAARAVWEHAMSLPAAARSAPPRWYHGDLVGENLLTRSDRLAAVLDFGALSVGDPTVDLIGAWELLDRPARQVFRRSIGVDEQTWLIGRAWALSLALRTFTYYWATMPQRCASRRVAIHAILTDATA